MSAPTDPVSQRKPRSPRGAARRRTLMAGKLVYGEGDALTADCTIRDFSKDGARVWLRAAAPLPARLHLIQVRTGLAFACEVAWRRAPEFGLKFTAAYDLAGHQDDSPWFLRRIWVESAAR